tara:strand:+ start:1507 stop:3414 length:1908 start_codon:yes stop_codon:yes gene_type:complete
MKKIIFFVFINSILFSLDEVNDGILFSYKDMNANSVFLVGSMNDWNTSASPMKKDTNGNWEIILKLDSGKYTYKFLVDNVWNIDQDNLNYEDDGYGGSNSLIEIDAKGQIIQNSISSSDIKSNYNPKIYFKGRYYSNNIFNSDATERYMLNKPEHDLNFGIEIKFNPDFVGYTILSVNNSQENVEMWKTHFNYERSYIKLDSDFFSIVAFDNIGLKTFDEPLPTLGSIGFNGYDFGYGYSGVYFETSNQFKKNVYDIIPIDVNGELMFSDKSGYNEEDITAIRFNFSKTIIANKTISLGASKYNYVSNASNEIIQRHNTNSVDIKYIQKFFRNGWKDKMILTLSGQFSSYTNSNEDSIVTNWMNGSNIYTGLSLRFPAALNIYLSYQKSSFDLTNEFNRDRYTMGADLNINNFQWNINSQIWKNNFSDNLSWVDYYKYVEKSDCNGRWFEDHTDLSFSKYTLLGYKSGVLFESLMKYRFDFFNKSLETSMKNLFAQQKLLSKSKFIENIFMLKYDLSDKWILKINTRLPYYNDNFLNLKTDFSNNKDVYVSSFSEVIFYITRDAWLSLGYGVNPYIINPVTDQFYFRGREDYLNESTNLTEYLNSYYGGFGEKIREAEESLMDNNQVLIQAVINF